MAERDLLEFPAPDGLTAMPIYAAAIGSERFTFSGLAPLLASASASKTGDALAGLGAESSRHRAAARYALADVPLRAFLSESVVPYEDDDVTQLIIDGHDAHAFAPVSALTVGDFRDWLLSEGATADVLGRLASGLTPEMVAAVSKLMRNQDLIAVARKCVVTSAFRNTLGRPGTLATRLQPNHPTDDLDGILAATLDGLMMASGDAVIGVNPATDSLSICHDLLSMLDDLRQAYRIPVQACVLTHITTSLRLIEHGAPIDLVFQSVAGTQGANGSFGIQLAMLEEARIAAEGLGRGTVGSNVMYFETGQGSALSSGTHHGVDQQTLEARAYGVARAYRPLLVNNVVGFIGPEYINGADQLVRAGLEDHFCGKLLGLPMGTDVCYTNHAAIDQNDIEVLATLLGVAGVTFLIAVPGADDVMLNYQSLSFHDILYLRSVLGLRPTPEFEAWLREMGIVGDGPDLALLASKPNLLRLPPRTGSAG
jgi:ethanolamine ammonia-lyase large subunit